MSGLEAGRTVCTPQASPGLDASRGGPWRPVGALSQWRAVLLDMNGTFMFGGDRLGADDDHAGDLPPSAVPLSWIEVLGFAG